MAGRFFTCLTITNVVAKERGRKEALRKFVFCHKRLEEEFDKWMKFGDRPLNINKEYYVFNDDIDEFIKTLDLRIIEERPRLVDTGDRYIINVDYTIEQL